MPICQQCGKQFEKNPRYHRHVPQKYCSPECRDRVRMKWRKDYMIDYWIRSPDKLRQHKTYYKQLRARVLVHYSGLPPRCQKCRTEDINSLIVVGENKLHGIQLYLWLIKQKFPNGYKVLCRKCSYGRSANQ
jgi:hypothetical protein